MPNALQALNPPNQNQLYLILNNTGFNQPDQSNALGLKSYKGRPLMVLREDQLQNALGAAPGFSPGELETNALRAMDLGGNIGTSIMPGVGDVRDLGEAVTGRDWWTGSNLSNPERLAGLAAAAVPFLGMGGIKAINPTVSKIIDAIPDEAGDWLYHVSPREITEILPNKGRFGSSLFFSDSPSHGLGREGEQTYKIDLSNIEDQIDDPRTWFYNHEVDWNKIRPQVDEIMELVGADQDTAEELLSQRKFIQDLADDLGLDPVDAGDYSWDIQKIAGDAARALGYRGLKMPDEHGISYMIDMAGKEHELRRIKRK